MGKEVLLIDISRLIWRVWSGRLPTGIDRVCLAYLEHFGQRAQAVVQYKGKAFVLSFGRSQALFALIKAFADGGHRGFRLRLMLMLPALLLASSKHVKRAGMIYLNIGHTGLNAPTLPLWVRRNALKAVYLVHDLIPITNPEYCRTGEAARHKLRMTHALESAAGIIGNSRATLDELAVFAGAHGLPMPPSIEAWISGTPIPQGIVGAQRDRPYFVTVGTIEGRKNHILLLNIWHEMVRRMGDRAPVLLIIGQRGWEAGPALAMLDHATDLSGHVLELGRCDDAEMARLIAGARALLMPSFAEGFGLPVVEALELRTPVIISDLPVFHEIAGDIPTYLDPSDAAGWERTILDFTSDSAERQRQIEAMANYCAPNWPEHFARVEPWLDQL